jgi:hypothetical protein
MVRRPTKGEAPGEEIRGLHQAVGVVIVYVRAVVIPT